MVPYTILNSNCTYCSKLHQNETSGECADRNLSHPYTINCSQISIIASSMLQCKGTVASLSRGGGNSEQDYYTRSLLCYRFVNVTLIFDWSQTLQTSSKFLHMVSRRKKFLAGSVINFSTQQVCISVISWTYSFIVCFVWKFIYLYPFLGINEA